MRPSNDISGRRYDTLLVVKESHRKNKDLLWECVCDCGEICFASSTDLNRGRRGFCKTCSKNKSIETCYSLLFNNYKRNAEQRGKSFNLDIKEFKLIISQDCFYCGLEPKQMFTKPGLKELINYNGIDRQDNSIGYEIENCVPCCKFCNLTKSRFSVEEFTEWLNHLRNK